MDKRKNYYLVIDTETANTIEQPIVFDEGGAVIDKKGNVYEKFSFIVDEIFNEMPDLMESCYYQAKLPAYREQIAEGTRIVKSYYEIRKHIHDLCKKYDIKAIIAHNANFDYRSCTITQRYITKSKYRWFFPYDIEIWDTLKMANDTIVKQKSYIRFCEENGYMTKHKVPKPRATAEILYRYITGNNDFEESHTALEDVLIEKDIFVQCLKQHKKMRKKIRE